MNDDDNYPGLLGVAFSVLEERRIKIDALEADNARLRELLNDARDSVEYEMNTLLPHAGYPRYAENIAALRGRLQLIDAANAAKEGENVT